MKKVWISTFLLTVLLCVGCFGKINRYKEINYQDLMEKFEQKETFILFIGATSCSHCTLYKETLNDVIKKYQVEVFYIDVDHLKQEEDNKLRSYANYTGTPTTVFIKEGKETSMHDRIDGALSYNKIVEKFQKQGYIK